VKISTAESRLNSSLGFFARIAIGHHNLKVCTRAGEGCKSAGKSSGPVFNLFSPQHDLFHGHCHIEFFLLALRIATPLTMDAGPKGEAGH
jgi:hypothetical protein